MVFDLPLGIIEERRGREGRMSLQKVTRLWEDFQANKPTEKELLREGYDEVYFVKG